MTRSPRRSPAAAPAEPAAPRAPARLRGIGIVAGKVMVIAAVVWHMFAVFIYAIPSDAQDRFAKFTQSALLPYVTDYILYTSQWQQWNLFAPDPIRRVTYYQLQTSTPSGWRDVVTFQPGSFPWWQHANRFKLLLGVMEGSSPDVSERLVHLLCSEYNLEPGSLARMNYLVSIVPWTKKPQDHATWKSWKYPFDVEGGFDATCPDPPLPLP